MMDYYRGFWIQSSVLKQWIATRYGVEVCARSKDALRGVIDRYIEEREHWIEQRKKGA
jgi:hypothetical protein